MKNLSLYEKIFVYSNIEKKTSISFGIFEIPAFLHHYPIFSIKIARKANKNQ
jgi:hypothetical protein